jgi:hypothetical protein
MIAMGLAAALVVAAGTSALWFESREEAEQARAAQVQAAPVMPPVQSTEVTEPDAMSIEQDLLALERQTPPPDATAAERPADAARASAEPPRSPDLSGTWHLSTHIQSASYGAYEGLRLGFRVTLAQDGARLTGRGLKWTENGRGLPAEARTPIALDGTIEGGRGELTFTEQGAERKTSGRISVEVTGAGELQGTFTSDAAQSRGTVYARRAR